MQHYREPRNKLTQTVYPEIPAILVRETLHAIVHILTFIKSLTLEIYALRMTATMNPRGGENDEANTQKVAGT